MYQKSNRNQQSVLYRVVTAVMLLLTVVSSVVLVMVYIGSYVNPNSFWPFSFLILAMPLIMLINTILMLYWVFRWKWFFVIPLVVLLFGLSDVSVFFKPTFAQKYHDSVSSEKTVKILSYNVGGFYSMQDDGRMVSVVDSTLARVKQMDVDIICFQEFEANYKYSKSKIDSVLADWKYNNIYYTRDRGGENGWGLAVYSKYPILERGGVQYPSNNGSMWMDVLVDKDTIHLVNNHLQSMNVTRVDMQMFDPKRDSTHIEKSKLRNVFHKMRDNFKLRADQADTMAVVISGYDSRTVVCGDFNDTPMSYTYKTMKGDLLDTFSESGTGRSNTFRGLFGVFRIDYIFHSEDIGAMNFKTLDWNLSDHNAIKVELVLSEL